MAEGYEYKESGSCEIDFSAPWEMSDVAFIVEDKPIYVNKTTMSMWSPVMKAMFSGDFKEKGTEEIPLPGKKYKDVLELVKVLHPCNNGLNDNCYAFDSLLSLAREYQITNLTKRCEAFLLQSDPSLHKLALAEEFNFPGVHMKCMEYVENSVVADLNVEAYYHKFSDNTKLKILQKTMKAEKVVSLLKKKENLQQYCCRCRCTVGRGADDCPYCIAYNIKQQIIEDNYYK